MDIGVNTPYAYILGRFYKEETARYSAVADD